MDAFDGHAVLVSPEQAIDDEPNVWPAAATARQHPVTGQTFTRALAGNGIAISMDGKGAWRDNVFVEQLWRSVKYEEVHLMLAAASVRLGRGQGALPLLAIVQRRSGG